MNRFMRALRGRRSRTEDTLTLWVKSLLNALVFFAVFMVALPWLAHQLLPVALPIPRWLGAWGGGALFVVGLGVWVVCLDAFSRRGRGTPSPGDAPRRLVVDGLHGVIRNPIIAGEILVIWGEAVWLASLGVLAYALLATRGAHWVVVRVEEPVLRERFGESYEAYCRKVPRWIPLRRAVPPARNATATGDRRP